MTVAAPPMAPQFAEDLEFERGLIRIYRLLIPSAVSPRLRQAWERGLALKRRHETELEGLLAGLGATPPADRAASEAVPPAREILPWIVAGEHSLALRYRDRLRAADDAEMRRLVARWAADQTAYEADLKRLYRDFSSS
ncbi:MAG: ferritin-like domain-containing protein [Nitrospiria bacterium]